MPANRSLVAVAWLLLIVSTAGCRLASDSPAWCPPEIPITVTVSERPMEQLAAEAALADRQQDPRATDLYFEAAVTAWRELEAPSSSSSSACDSAGRVYHDCLARLLEISRDNGRWVPGQGIQIETESGTVWVPIQPIGFVWRADEFEALHPVGAYHSTVVTRPHCRAGLGVPVVVDRANSGPQRPGDLYLPPKIAFNATAVMRPSSGATGLSDLQVVLELHNPQCDPPVDCPTGPHPLAADISAAFAYRELDLNLEPSPFEMFVYPDSNPAFEGLYFLEPYQPGKIPVVFVHGLMSSPRTWIDTANDLRANPEFNARYQIWAFDYATGKPFVRAAAELRQALCDVTSELAAAGDDPALREIVLVGHSMGGLISKLQVTQSGDDLWNSIANEPIDQVALAPAVRNLAYEVFFFEPLPQVRRVIFVGTPHRGAAAATRLVGQISSTLVRRSPEELAMHRQIVADNRGAFRFSLQRRLPTSIDMLEPCNSMLRAIDCLPISDAVHIHTIAGTGKYTVGVAAGDGVVPLKSAVHPLAESELLVKASHTQLHRHPESVDEIWRILDEHARECR